MDRGWIAVDWGTTNLRVWVFAADGTELAHASSDRGMGQLTSDVFEPALLELVGDFLPSNQVTPVICCGMVGARQGWIEAPYLSVPCKPPGIGNAIGPEVKDPRLDVHILPGVSQNLPADVMRGEETQIGGFLQNNPGFDGAVCLPGTHTKWVQVSAGEIVSFRTFMTGELFSLLSERSVLRHSLVDEGWDEAAFNDACNDAMTSPQHLSARLFALRAGSLLHGLTPSKARARLSGSLIGLELAGSRPYWLGREVAIIGAVGLAGLYDRALTGVGVSATIADAEAMTLAGLSSAFVKMKEQNK
ncbi:2-keto-3-deoxy-galactonokinase [Rhodobacteraceae bacterium (ex Bugula neritina AB1)]|nr:2-keto-3-deoxy-galactonokinase [Rhodobacteraceae bacterium (ex Bugula neritina AB1)]